MAESNWAKPSMSLSNSYLMASSPPYSIAQSLVKVHGQILEKRGNSLQIGFVGYRFLSCEFSRHRGWQGYSLQRMTEAPLDFKCPSIFLGTSALWLFCPVICFSCAFPYIAAGPQKHRPWFASPKLFQNKKRIKPPNDSS